MLGTLRSSLPRFALEKERMILGSCCTCLPSRSTGKRRVRTPQALFELPQVPPAWIQSGVDQRVYAPSVDGQRFLIGVPVGEESSAPINVVLNWTTGLKRN